MFNRSDTSPKCYSEWFSPATKLTNIAPGLNECWKFAGLGVISDQFVFAVGGINNWIIERFSRNTVRIYGGIVVDRPLYFIN